MVNTLSNMFFGPDYFGAVWYSAATVAVDETAVDPNRLRNQCVSSDILAALTMGSSVTGVTDEPSMPGTYWTRPAVAHERVTRTQKTTLPEIMVLNVLDP